MSNRKPSQFRFLILEFLRAKVGHNFPELLLHGMADAIERKMKLTAKANVTGDLLPEYAVLLSAAQAAKRTRDRGKRRDAIEKAWRTAIEKHRFLLSMKVVPWPPADRQGQHPHQRFLDEWAETPPAKDTEPRFAALRAMEALGRIPGSQDPRDAYERFKKSQASSAALFQRQSIKILDFINRLFDNATCEKDG